jgi:hypothetical protein
MTPENTSPGLPAHGIPASGVARRHPDRQTTWIIVHLVRVSPAAMPSPALLRDRLSSATAVFPLMASRLRDGRWVPASGPSISFVDDQDDPLALAPLQRMALDREPPVRLVASTTGQWLLVCAHHFAFDGLGMVSLLRSLLTGEDAVAPPDYTSISSPRRFPTDALRRVLRPADRVAPSDVPPRRESFVARKACLAGPGVTARLARACANAAVAHNDRQGHRTNRIGLTVAVGGVRGEAATYRRLDVVPGQDIEGAVTTAMSDPRVPAELVRLPPGAFLLQPALHRLSDTLLVSNLGRVELPGATEFEAYGVPRGRSAVAIGAVGLPDQPTTITLRARDLSPEDAAHLLDQIMVEMTDP